MKEFIILSTIVLVIILLVLTKSALALFTPILLVGLVFGYRELSNCKTSKYEDRKYT